MINCPKCGFSQPPDRYCANCGIDMQAYKPVPPSLGQKILKNPLTLPVSLTLLVFLGIATYRIFFSQGGPATSDAELEQSMRLPFADSPNSSTSTGNEAPTAKSPTSPENNMNSAVEKFSDKNSAEPSLEMTGALASGKPTEPETKALDKASEKTAPSHLQITFFSIPRAQLLDFASDLHSPGSSGSIFYGVIVELESRLKKAEGMLLTRLEQTPKYQIRANQPIVSFKGVRDPATQQMLGIGAQITPLRSDETATHLQVDLSRTLREAGGGIAEQNISEQITLSKDQAFFVGGLFPHRTLEPEDAKFYSNSGLLKILSTPDFQNNETEFIVLIESK